MKVRILHIIEPTMFGTAVEFSTTYGVGRSLFSCPQIQENQTYDLEIDITTKGTDLFSRTKKMGQIYFLHTKINPPLR